MLDPNATRRDRVAVFEGAGATVYVAFGGYAAIASALLKASPDDPEHPGWPAGTPGGLGGKFRPKDKAEAAVKRVALRRRVRTLLVQALSLPIEALGNLVPVLGEIGDAAMLVQLAQTAAELRQLDIDTKAALDFIAKGPYSLDDLRVSPEFESYSSYDRFYKDLAAQDVLARRFGRAGPGYQYHHIVEQGGANATALPARELQTTDNIIRMPTLLHEAITGLYSKKPDEGQGLTLRAQIRTEGFSKQREQGIQVLQEIGIVK